MEGYLCSAVAQPLNEGCSKKAVTSDSPCKSGMSWQGETACRPHLPPWTARPPSWPLEQLILRGPRRRRKESKAGLRGIAMGTYPKLGQPLRERLPIRVTPTGWKRPDLSSPQWAVRCVRLGRAGRRARSPCS